MKEVKKVLVKLIREPLNTNKKYKIQEFKEYIYTNSEFHLKRKYEKFD